MTTPSPRSKPVLRALVILFAYCLLVAVDLRWRDIPTPAALAVVGPSNTPAIPSLALTGQGHIPMPLGVASAHAANLLTLPPDHPWSLMAFWFAGSREAAPDIQIASAHLDRHSGSWSLARYAVDRDDLGIGTTRLGNPVPWLDRQGRVHLFVVATGLGGWAAARIVHLRQRETASLGEEHGFAVQQVLPLSWLWNYSFLVRSTPLELQDHGMVLPVYFEMGPHSSPVALRFNADGDLCSFTRMAQGRQLIQPALLALSDTRWLALMRDAGPQRRIRVSGTSDAGAHWIDTNNLPLPNPDASVATLRLPDGTLLLAHNATTEGRHILDLSASLDGMQWTRVRTLAQGNLGTEYSYPSLAWDGQQLWVSYTDQRRQIAWQRFTVSPTGH